MALGLFWGRPGPALWGLLAMGGFSAVAPSGWALLAAFACLGVRLAISDAGPVFLTIWLVNAALLAWKYRQDLSTLPRLRVERVAAWLHP